MRPAASVRGVGGAEDLVHEGDRGARAFAFGVRLARLLQCVEAESDQPDSSDRRRGDTEAMAAHETRGVIQRTAVTRLHRTAVEEGFEVGNERIDRAVTRVCFLRERSAHDGVEIAVEFASERTHGVTRGRCIVAATYLCQRAPQRDRIVFNHGAAPGMGVVGIRVVGQAAGDDAVEQHAELVNVGRDRDRLAAELFGGRILRRHRADALRRHRTEAFFADQFGDAEIEQFRMPVAGDDDVRRLDVAMDDEVAMRVRQRAGHPQHQAQPAFHIGQVVAAEIGDRDAFDVFHREERRAVVGFATIDQLRDVRVSQAGKDFLFLAESVAQAGVRGQHQLDRDLLFEAAIDAMREIDRAHAARAQQFVEHEGADATADLFAVPVAHTTVVGHRRCDQVDDRTIQRRGFLVFAEQAHDIGAQAFVGDGVEEGCALVALAVERAIEQLAHGAPALSIHDD